MSLRDSQHFEHSYFAGSLVEKPKRILLSYLNFFKDLGISLNGKSVLELGCGTGRFVPILPTDVNYVGADISSFAISQCKELYPESSRSFLQLDLENCALPTPNMFDLIIIFDVIEHLRNFSGLNEIVQKNLKEHGYIIITTPNASSPLRYFKKIFSGEIDSTHTMLFTPYTLDFFLRRLGLEKVSLVTPFAFYFKNNLLTKNFLLGGQIFCVYKKIPALLGE